MILEPGIKSIDTHVMLNVMSAISSSIPVASAILVGQLCLLWYVFALVNISLLNHDEDGRFLDATLVMIFVFKIFSTISRHGILLRENSAVHIDALSGNGTVFWR